MSLRSMAVMRAMAEDDKALGKDPDSATEQKKLRDQLIALIPTESISLFVALIGAMAALAVGWRWAAFGAVLAMTPGWVLINFLNTATTKEAKEKLPWFEMAIGTAAFLAWATTVPTSPFDDIGITSQVGAIIVVLTAGVLTYLVSLRAAWRKRQAGDP